MLPIRHACQNYNVNTDKELIILDSETRRKSLFYSFLDYYLAYREQKTAPTNLTFVAQQLLKCLDENNGKTDYMRKYDAKRYKQGTPIGQLDGVFVTIEEEMDIQGCEARGSTKFVNVGKPAERDTNVPQRLRESGAITVDYAVMNEMSGNTFTVNPNKVHF
ncbi:hypothetical protein BJV82DRAFT_668286 [Fennellomyces sp. T-0311]|nr:hypothetical protein BJV82DRAFT_668286 [Fennellomyces sp. T-0311]